MTPGRRLLFALPLLLSILSCHRGTRAPDVAGSPPTGWGSTFRCQVQNAEGARRFRLVLGARAPDRFRLEIYGPVGGVRLVVASDGRVVSAAAPSRRLYAEGEATPAAFGELLGLPVAGADLLALLEGHGLGRPANITRLTPGGEVRFQQLWEEGRLREVEIRVEGDGRARRAFRVLYDDHRDVAGRMLPHRTRVVGSEETLLLVRQETVLGGPAEAAFRIAEPPRFERVGLARIGSAGARLFAEGE